MSGPEEHQEALLAAFAAVLKSEQSVGELEASLARAESAIKLEIAERKLEAREAWSAIEALMRETGEVEVILPGESNDYRIGWNSPRESVKADADAAPDEFVKIERTPKLKEIGDHLKKLRASGSTPPNWASLERGLPRLQWKPVKKA